jgi:hypothetical protein
MNVHRRTKRTMVATGIMIVIVSLHVFRVGSYLSGAWFTLYYSYFSDVVIPFGFYFMLTPSEANVKFLRPWYAKALLVFGAASATEIAQAFGIYMLGVTFDPIDIVMFGIGVLLAAFVDRVILGRIFPFWALGPVARL